MTVRNRQARVRKAILFFCVLVLSFALQGCIPLIMGAIGAGLSGLGQALNVPALSAVGGAFTSAAGVVDSAMQGALQPIGSAVTGGLNEIGKGVFGPTYNPAINLDNAYLGTQEVYTLLRQKGYAVNDTNIRWAADQLGYKTAYQKDTITQQILSSMQQTQQLAQPRPSGSLVQTGAGTQLSPSGVPPQVSKPLSGSGNASLPQPAGASWEADSSTVPTVRGAAGKPLPPGQVEVLKPSPPAQGGTQP